MEKKSIQKAMTLIFSVIGPYYISILLENFNQKTYEHAELEITINLRLGFRSENLP